MVVDFKLGDVLHLKKPHPCGNYVWIVVRIGADIGIRCQKCGRRVLVPRSQLERRVKEIKHREVPATSSDGSAGRISG
jgi:hypothetical protein